MRTLYLLIPYLRERASRVIRRRTCLTNANGWFLCAVTLKHCARYQYSSSPTGLPNLQRICLSQKTGPQSPQHSWQRYLSHQHLKSKLRSSRRSYHLEKMLRSLLGLSSIPLSDNFYPDKQIWHCGLNLVLNCYVFFWHRTWFIYIVNFHRDLHCQPDFGLENVLSLNNWWEKML